MLLFGSVATSGFTQYSDADVLVVSEHLVDWETIYACSDGVVQPVVKTRGESAQLPQVWSEGVEFVVTWAE